MKKLSVYFVFFVLLLWVVNACTSNTDTDKEGTGYIAVHVDDYTSGPVPGVDIYVAPDSIMNTTDSTGNAFFTLDAGDYYIDADVCCVGPGYIKYHEAVKVLKGDTAKVKLQACLSCE